MDAGYAIALLVSNVVGAGVAIVATSWQQRRGFVHEREQADRPGVRGLLSEAVGLLHRLEYALDDANVTLIQWGGAFFEDEERATSYRELEAAGRETDALRGQLEVLLGSDHPATRAFREAATAMLDAFRALGLIRMEEPTTREERADPYMAELVDEQRKRVGAARESFGTAKERFLRAAHAAAGATL